ncbi:hypothetical protein ACSQ67_016642 [Phaseolus vulgaris]
MASWNWLALEVAYEALGWFAFVSWSISFYPQVILNFRRKSVVGLNFDFVVLNLTKHSTYLIYNASLYFSSAIQKQYFDKYGYGEMIPVAANDVAFSIHAVLLTAITLFQIAIYERGSQKVSKVSIGIVSVAWLIAAVCFFIALSNHSWLWLLSMFNLWYDVRTKLRIFFCMLNYLRSTFAVVLQSMFCVNRKYQAVMNFLRKSTDGFSIGNILLDFSGGVANYGQMVVQSIDQNSWVNFYGNIGKVVLSLVSVFFDIIFIIQHYVLYAGNKSSKSEITTEHEDQIREQLVRPSDLSPPDNA